MNRTDSIKLGLAIGAVGIAVVVFAMRTAGPAGPKATFYDLSERKLYEAPMDAFAPHAGIGGERDDGVEAVVIECPECSGDKPEIAYLRTHTPEYKVREEESRAAGGPIEGLTREYIKEHTLIKRVDDEEWVTAASEGGSAIVTGWKKKCPSGHWMKRVRED